MNSLRPGRLLVRRDGQCEINWAPSALAGGAFYRRGLRGLGTSSVASRSLAMRDMKSRALSANSLDAMLEVADAVRHSTEATPDQIAAASAAWRSIRSALEKATSVRIEVAHKRFAKLMAVL